MITPNDIADRLEEMVRESFPEEPVYRELRPNGFQRPCTLIVQEDYAAEPGYGTGIVALRPVFTLTTFVPVDEHYHSHMAPMHLRQLKLAGMFLPGCIRVGDRSPHVEKLVMGGGYDYDTVTVTFSVTLDREDFMELERAPLADQLRFRLKIDEKKE